MSTIERARKLMGKGLKVLMPRAQAPDPADQEAWNDAVLLWSQLFEPFSPLVEGADVLELGCGDGRLAGALAASGQVRSVVGVDRLAWWRGEGEGVAWRPETFSGLELHADLLRVQSLDEGAFDLILSREFDGVVPLEGLEDMLAWLYGLLRPGGEMIARFRCADPQLRPDGPGYGLMTPTAWTALVLGAGFEIAETRRFWRGAEDQRRLSSLLPDASDEERMTAELHLRLVRPWESWELDALRPFGDRRRTRKARRNRD